MRLYLVLLFSAWEAREGKGREGKGSTVASDQGQFEITVPAGSSYNNFS
ncbi:hypothetical protein MMC2321_01662 [Chitinophaga sp. MM2321]